MLGGGGCSQRGIPRSLTDYTEELHGLPIRGRRCVRSPTPKGRRTRPQRRVMNSHQSQLEVFDVTMVTARDLNA